ncbi:senecionine N-oxygenase-like [Photinus pyralis]|uniref:senecionine N-oxygenase-like n=1 Tax=Photinus pyralis TaxID=7054 RepID=UPI00126714B9|nr:senecionine N-oxygenase-like [Photinus pyralis]
MVTQKGEPGKVAIIGAGVCGLISLRYAKESGHQCDVFEQTGEFGGTWVYTDNYGIDENGLPITRNLYQDLITNVPKEMMEFLNFRHSSDINESYITQPLVLKYLRDFADKFDLEKHIQYYSYVTKVEPHDDRWTVTVRDVKRKEERSECYDAVFICNGSFAHPRMPEVKGEKLFKGLLFHSCDYRSTTLFVNKRVLVVGGSFSAVDISRLIIPVAQKVYIRGVLKQFCD